MSSLARELLKKPTDRDRQVLAGPSSLGSSCDACVARALRNESEEENYYWLGAVVGTAIHNLLEKRSKGLPGVLLEQRVFVGLIPGYGEIWGSVDRVDVKEKTARDWKTTTKKDKAGLQKAYASPEEVEGEPLTVKGNRLKIAGYVGQLHLYGKALRAAGFEVDKLIIEFICRDGSSDDDIFVFEYDYDEHFAELLWDRILYIWDHLDTEKFASEPHCIACAFHG